MSFKGFDRIGNLEYTQNVFLCPHCDNQCDVNIVSTEDGPLYYGDRCERYSGAKTKENSSNPRNPFLGREEILKSYSFQDSGGRRTVGIPRVGMFYELFPLWSVFFRELDMNVVTSDKTKKRIVEEGLKKSTAEFCYPFKVAFGHFASLNDKADYIFAPDIIQSYRSQFKSFGQIAYTAWDRSRTCPYIQNFGSVVAKNVSSIDVINPQLSLRDENKRIVKELDSSFRKVNLEFSKKELNRAFSCAQQGYDSFKTKLGEKGRETLEQLVEKQKGIVIVGRPYSAFDEEMNLRLSKKILHYGFLPLPMDFLPLPTKDLSEKWTNEFSIQ